MSATRSLPNCAPTSNAFSVNWTPVKPLPSPLLQHAFPSNCPRPPSLHVHPRAAPSWSPPPARTNSAPVSRSQPHSFCSPLLPSVFTLSYHTKKLGLSKQCPSKISLTTVTFPWPEFLPMENI